MPPPLAPTAAVEGEQCPGVPPDAAFPTCDEVQPEPSGELIAPTEFSLAAAARNPCVSPSPDIDYTGLLAVDRAARELVFKVFIDRFPAFEAYAQADGGTVNKLFCMGPIGQSPAELFGGPAFLISGKKRL